MVKLDKSNLEKVLHHDLTLDDKYKFDRAFDSISYQSKYCCYHYAEFVRNYKNHKLAMYGELDEEVKNPQYYRIAFESNAIAFFRCLHSLVESVPYILNIIFQIENDKESRKVDWRLIKNFCDNNNIYETRELIEEMQKSPSYKELSLLVNISKHRRLLRVDSGLFSDSPSAQFLEKDFEDKFQSYNIQDLMERFYYDLHPYVLRVINSCGTNS
ncbi:hypothetical protein EXA20_17985 [Vibrio cincinnatiensis]|uniref:hypothetical protein n=2 Tax=Vibrio TaxID=662 RepID=UPI001C30D854|nr:hypothetical protein [Vibrio metschnikovii]MCG3738231.1 hypothetical protein [Vibrio cincinnatiensis]MCG3748819.1 hypothetical protein [Vibrio cincinnatiensis]